MLVLAGVLNNAAWLLRLPGNAIIRARGSGSRARDRRTAYGFSA